MQTQIMILSRNARNAKDIFGALNLQKSWEIIVLLDEEQALEALQRQHFDVLIFGKDISEADEKKVRKISAFLHEDILFFRQNAEGVKVKDIAAILNDRALKRRREMRVTDDAFKNVSLNISLN